MSFYTSTLATIITILELEHKQKYLTIVIPCSAANSHVRARQ